MLGFAGVGHLKKLRGSVERRDFCVQACQAAALAALGGLTARCGGDSGTSPSGGTAPALPTVNATSAGNVVTVTIAAGSPLDPVGGAALVRAPSRELLVFRASASAFNTMTAVCTHEQCTITGFASSMFE